MGEYINGAIIQEDFTMEKTIYDESNGLWYELRGDYYIPAWQYRLKRKDLSAFGGGGTCNTSRRSANRCTWN